MGNYLFMYLAIFLIVAAIILLAKYAVKAGRRNRVAKISLGMSENEMLKIMGRRYNKSLLKNDRVKYEWRYSNGGSTGSSYRGNSVRKYHGVSKVDIYCKNGCVEEVRPHNI
ncbi:hypothetical protein [Butyrivibrio sp. FCS014]|uniref:hypothetical protein n=1 Tax=Butyrivibrio sp. FCS014 TaxID=1408304 RepID=UPI000463C899|nr:hypothetical protein [Butyrivibrio sp. FCS014]